MPVSSDPNVSVVFCAYADDRWEALAAAVESVRQQTMHPRETIVVIDHNPRLLDRVRTCMPDIIALENTQLAGAGGARNTGVEAASGAIIAFLDDDAEAAPDWLERLIDCYEDPGMLGVGGAIDPNWLARKPSWFPSEFAWVVGCTYTGMPETRARIRNLIAANMSVRRDVYLDLGGFHPGFGNVKGQARGSLLRLQSRAGDEEVEFCIRGIQKRPGCYWLHEPRALVYHRVPAQRTRFKYFLTRCYHEGLGAASIVRSLGTGDGLSTERVYVFKTLPRGVVNGLADVAHGDLAGFGRSGSIIAGLAVTSASYLLGSAAQRVSTIGRKRPDALPGARPSDSPTGAAPNAPVPNKATTQDSRSLDGNVTGRHVERSRFTPLRVLEVELGDPLPDIGPCEAAPGRLCEQVLIYARLHTRPLGAVQLTLERGCMSAQECARGIWQALSAEIRTHLEQDGLPVPDILQAAGLPGPERPRCLEQRMALLANAPFVSIVVGTRDRPASLATCLRALLALDYPRFEIVVVDNAPSSSATADLIREAYGSEPRVRYLREDRPGTAWARNRGLQAVRGEIVAFTDDDVTVDRYWLAELAAGFTLAENVGCVTGATFPMELQTQAQLWFEIYGCFSNGYARRVFDLAEHRFKSRLYPYAAGVFGAGVNMAYRTKIARAIGGFDPALGGGSPARGGEDIAMFFQIVSAGYTLIYEPGAIVRHLHRRDYSALRKQMYGYGVGFTAYLTKCMIDRPACLRDVPTWIPTAISFVLRGGSKRNVWAPYEFPRELTMIERKGMLLGPFAYIWSRQQARKLKDRAAQEA